MKLFYSILKTLTGNPDLRLVTSLALLFSVSAWANDPTARFPGYAPTVLPSKAEVDEVFNYLPTDFKNPWRTFNGSQCFHRAHIWSYDLAKNRSIQTMKTFVFYTHQYREWHKKVLKKKFDWWFHVSPYVLSKNNETGAVEEWVIDATFADRPQNMKEWTDLFVFSKMKCAEDVPYSKFSKEVENVPGKILGKEHCYVVRVPAVDLEPVQVAQRTNGTLQSYNWYVGEVKEAIEKASRGNMEEVYKKRLGIK